MKQLVMIFVSLMLFGGRLSAQNRTKEELAYIETVTKRAEKILSSLELKDSAKYNKVRDVIVDQYLHLNLIHAVTKSAKGETDTATVKGSKEQLNIVHKKYLRELNSELDNKQVDKIKDGMTYNVLHVTYKAYQDMIPSLKEAEKSKILTWLTEARELAMDAGTSEEKHQVFGKYKGRINNYLSGLGYNLQAERKAWEERTKAAKSN
jgi:hypothetical protein